MKPHLLSFLLFLPAVLSAQKTKPEIFARIDASRATYDEIALKIWDFAEVGYREQRSSALLQ
ncbi:MAG: amidohydrolase, partial [Opitutaceae bacterium]